MLATATLGSAVDEARRWLVIEPFYPDQTYPAADLGARLRPATEPGDPFGHCARRRSHGHTARPGDGGDAVRGLVGLFRPNRLTFGASMVCAISFAITWLLPDRLPALPFVDHILWTGFDIGLWVGVTLWAGCLLLISPILFVSRIERNVAEYVLVASWLTLIVAVAMGAYPTPMVEG